MIFNSSVDCKINLLCARYGNHLQYFFLIYFKSALSSLGVNHFSIIFMPGVSLPVFTLLGVFFKLRHGLSSGWYKIC